jgi:hypothetical protein
MPELALAERGAMARAIANGQLVLESGRVLSAGETQVVIILIREGRRVHILTESTVQGVRTADFLVNGVRTELKTIQNITSRGTHRVLSLVVYLKGQVKHLTSSQMYNSRLE